MNNHYKDHGYVVFNDMFDQTEIQSIREVVLKFHRSWIQENSGLYAQRAINSAYLTSPDHLKNDERNTLFKLIGSSKLMDVVTSLMGNRPAFMNTQLFFNPSNKAQENYWHRDPQYHLSIEEQIEALSGPSVLHFRIPLADEPGLEFVPGSHKRWDTKEEHNVRLEKNGHKNNEDLSTAKRIALNAGDLLAFNANMIHRGIYGLDRLSLDILFCDPVPELLQFADKRCLPDAVILEQIEHSHAFKTTLSVMNGTFKH